MVTKPYHIRIAPAAERQIHALAPKNQKAIIKLIEALAVNPRPPGAKKIEGMMGLYSYSEEMINHMRLIYKVEEQEVLLLVVKL
ncbi:MAG: type II toxin-antitoxin system RelE/ParE family toxin [Gammaproteobacteria bacterium]|nr:MAG: type II toxin-antitoxin system RelE/ParE family toxin [Gammaproteobacteria bacterium]